MQQQRSSAHRDAQLCLLPSRGKTEIDRVKFLDCVRLKGRARILSWRSARSPMIAFLLTSKSRLPIMPTA